MYVGYIYRHWLINDKDIEKSYIGQTIESNIKNRWGKNGEGYIKDDKDRKKMARAIKKYGWESFNHEILLTIECETEEELWFWLDEWEKYCIEKYDSFYNGYNCTLGGCGTRGYKHTDETKKKLSRKLKGRTSPQKDKKASNETKTKQSDSHKKYYDTQQGLKQRQQHSERMCGELNPFYGKKHTEETRQKIRDSRKNYVGEKHPMYGKDGTFKGKKHTDETKQKMSKNMIGKNSRSQKIICLETKEFFVSIGQACKKYDIKYTSTVSKCCKGKAKTAGGYHWMYYEDYLKLQEEKQNNDNLDTNNKIA